MGIRSGCFDYYMIRLRSTLGVMLVRFTFVLLVFCCSNSMQVRVSNTLLFVWQIVLYFGFIHGLYAYCNLWLTGSCHGLYSWMLCFFSAGLCCMLMGDGLQLCMKVYMSKMSYVGSWVAYTLVYVVKFDLLGFALLSGY